MRKIGDIFQKAHRVTIWLGLGDSLTPSLFRYLRSIGRLVQVQDIATVIESALDPLVDTVVNSMTGTSVILQVLQPIRLVSYPGASMKGETTEMIESYARILNNPWFLRVWTVQECLVARKAMMMCGRSTMDWEAFAESSTASRASLINRPVYNSIFIRHKLF